MDVRLAIVEATVELPTMGTWLSRQYSALLPISPDSSKMQVRSKKVVATQECRFQAVDL